MEPILVWLKLRDVENVLLFSESASRLSLFLFRRLPKYEPVIDIDNGEDKIAKPARLPQKAQEHKILLLLIINYYSRLRDTTL